jgi:hypothetical protein
MKKCDYCGGYVCEDCNSCPSCAGHSFGSPTPAREKWLDITAMGDDRRTEYEVYSGRTRYAGPIAWGRR